MSYVDVEILQPDFERFQNALKSIPGALEKAQYDALKRAAQKGETQSARLAAAVYKISVGGIKSRMRNSFSGLGTASVTITFAGANIPLKSFQVTSHSGGVDATVIDGGKTIRKGFIDAKMGGGVFERVGKSRLPVEQKYSASPPQMVKNQSVQPELDNVILETYEQRMEHEVTRILNGW